MKKIIEELIKIVKEDSSEALGCTEPVAVAYCANVAGKYIDKNSINKIILKTSKNIYKNGKSVKIPNTNSYGLNLAASLGAYVDETSEGFMVFNKVDSDVKKNAEKLILEKKVEVEYLDDVPDIYVSVEIQTDTDSSIAIIKESHTHVDSIIINENVIFKSNDEYEEIEDKFDIKTLSLKELREIIEEIDFDKIQFILKGISVNRGASIEGLKGYGSNLAKALNSLKENGILEDSFITDVRIMTAAAADMRMGGGDCPIMTSGGSGNQGIGVILPISIVADQEKIEKERLAKAIFFAHCINRYVKEYSGKLSGICGCAIGAAIGATAGITWMLGGSDEQISGACTNIYANLTGIICDGAKESCSMKLSTSATESVISSYLSLFGVISDSNVGIIGESIEETISNIGKLSKEAFVKVDDTMLKILECN